MFLFCLEMEPSEYAPLSDTDSASSSSVARPSPRRVRRHVGRPRKVRPEDIDLTSEEEIVCAETSVVQRLPAKKHSHSIVVFCPAFEMPTSRKTKGATPPR